MNEQFQAVRLFDALLRNGNRSSDTLLYAIATGQSVLTGHEKSFSTRSSLFPLPDDTVLSITNLWRARLALIDSDTAQGELLPALGPKRYKALIKRASALAKADTN